MYLGLSLVAVVALGWAITAMAARRSTTGTSWAEVLDPDVADWEVLPEPGAEVPEVDLSEFGHLPPTYDPGLPVIRTITPPPGARPPLADELDPQHTAKDGGDSGWPQVA